jgi:hypothetical protein
MPFGGRRLCTRSIQCPERSASTVKFSSFARHALAKLENKEPGESSTAIREYQHDIRELKTNMARLEELHSLELLRSGR